MQITLGMSLCCQKIHDNFVKKQGQNVPQTPEMDTLFMNMSLSRTLSSVKIQSHHHTMKKWAYRRQRFSRLAGKMLFRGLEIIRKVHDFNKNKKINQKIFHSSQKIRRCATWKQTYIFFWPYPLTYSVR